MASNSNTETMGESEVVVSSEWYRTDIVLTLLFQVRMKESKKVYAMKLLSKFEMVNYILCVRAAHHYTIDRSSWLKNSQSHISQQACCQGNSCHKDKYVSTAVVQ